MTAKIGPDPLANLISPSAGPTAFTLRLPYALNKSWWISGAHSDAGGSIMSSLDMNAGTGGWGTDQSLNYVRASASGTFKRHSSCFAEVIHQYNWSTAYYHMDKLQFTTNQQVDKGVYIGIPASTKTQALCGGGASTGPHMHWTLLRYSSPVRIHNVKISGYTINANSTIQYDTNCSLNYLIKNGVKYCPFQYVPNN
ncbi:MAG: M23 family metallopeptidase [Lysobacter sp.]|nr:M23 family metallopeptidase [Lysobacter sp.]